MDGIWFCTQGILQVWKTWQNIKTAETPRIKSIWNCENNRFHRHKTVCLCLSENRSKTYVFSRSKTMEHMPHLSNKKQNALHACVCIYPTFACIIYTQHIWIEHAQMSFSPSAIFNTLPMLLADRIHCTLVVYALCCSGLTLMTLLCGGYKNILISVWLFYIGFFFSFSLKHCICGDFQLVLYKCNAMNAFKINVCCCYQIFMFSLWKLGDYKHQNNTGNVVDLLVCYNIDWIDSWQIIIKNIHYEKFIKKANILNIFNEQYFTNFNEFWIRILDLEKSFIFPLFFCSMEFVSCGLSVMDDEIQSSAHPVPSLLFFIWYGAIILF